MPESLVVDAAKRNWSYSRTEEAPPRPSSAAHALFAAQARGAGFKELAEYHDRMGSIAAKREAFEQLRASA